MTTIIEGFALVYTPIKEDDSDPDKLIEQTAVQANDMPRYLQEAIIKYLQETHKDIRFKRNDP